MKEARRTAKIKTQGKIQGKKKSQQKSQNKVKQRKGSDRSFKSLRDIEHICYSPSPMVMTQSLSKDSLQMLSLDNPNEQLHLQGASALLWNRLNGKTNLKMIIQSLTDKYSVSSERLLGDIDKFMKMLLKKKLIVASNSQSKQSQ
jgi:hypothetical protein